MSLAFSEVFDVLYYFRQYQFLILASVFTLFVSFLAWTGEYCIFKVLYNCYVYGFVLYLRICVWIGVLCIWTYRDARCNYCDLYVYFWD